MVMTCRRSTDYSDHPRKLVTLNPKLKSTEAPDATSFFPLVGCLPQAAWPEDFSPKSQDAVHCSRLRSVALYLWSWWYRSGNRPLQQYLGYLPGAGYGQFEHGQPDCKIQRSGRNSPERLMYEQSHRVISALVIRIVCLSPLLIITVITPYTKPSATKMPENWSWRTQQLLTCRCVSVMLLRSMQNTRRVSWC